MENPINVPEPATTSLILTNEELDVLLVAINDSAAKAKSVVQTSENPAEYNALVQSTLSRIPNIDQDRAEELVERAISLAEHLLEHYPKLVAQIKEVKQEVEDEDKLRKPPYIIKP